MDKEEQIRKGLKRLAEVPEGVFIARVTSVNKTNDTISIINLDGLDFHDVRLKSAINSNKDVVSYPAINSDVLVVSIGNDDNTLYVIGLSEVESISGKIGWSEFDIDSSGFKISRQGENLKEVLNDQIAELGKLCDELSKVVVLPGFGTTVNIPAVTLVKTNITQAIKKRLNGILK